MFFLSKMTRWIGTPDAGVLFDWSDCLQKRRIALSSTLLLAMFLCGAAAFVLPLASELAAYRADENAYAAIAEMIIHAPSPSPMPIIPLPAPTGNTENDTETAPLPGTESYPQAGMATDALALPPIWIFCLSAPTKKTAKTRNLSSIRKDKENR